MVETQKGLRQTLRTEVAVGGKGPDAQLDQWAITIRYEDEDSKIWRRTGRHVSRADDPVRTLSELVGERIAAAMAGRPVAAVVPLKTGRANHLPTLLWETLENSFHQRMLCERRRCLLPTAIRQVEPFLSEVQQVGFVVGT